MEDISMSNGRMNDTGVGKISQDALKLIAMVTMLIDHIGAVVIEGSILPHVGAQMTVTPQTSLTWQDLDLYLRIIGRIAFPIFCYLLVMGFMYTRSVKKYALRLFAFALISEVPFDLAFADGLTLGYQNVFWTLLIGLLTLIILKETEKFSSIGIRAVAGALVIAAGMGAAELLSTDYSYKGVVLIVSLYLFRKRRWLQCTVTPLLFLGSFFLELLRPAPGLDGIVIALAAVGNAMMESACVVGFILILFSNGVRRMKLNKYFFYVFYPLHIVILYGIGLVLESTSWWL